MRRVDSRLSSNAGIDHPEQRRRDLAEPNASHAAEYESG